MPMLADSGGDGFASGTPLATSAAVPALRATCDHALGVHSVVKAALVRGGSRLKCRQTASPPDSILA